MESKPILYIQTAFLGDLLLAVPTLKRIRRLFPKNPLILVCRKGFASLFLKLNLVDKAYEVEKKNTASYKKIKQQLKEFEFKWIFCPHESLTTANFIWNLKAEKKISFKKWWNGPYFSDRIKKPYYLPEALRQMSLLQIVDNDSKIKISNYEDSQTVPDWANPIVAIDENITSHSSTIVFFPGSVWPTKKWTEKGFVEVGKYLSKKNFQVILMGSADEKDLCQKISNQIPNSINKSGQTSLFESLLILKNSKLVLSNDSGGQHLASLTGTPTVSIFGPTVPSQGFRPWNSVASIVEIKAMPCRPCGKHGHLHCPIGTHACMKEISAEEVIRNINLISPCNL